MHRQIFSLALLILLGLTSCATIPEREFGNYLTTFEQVRKASELVLLDYAVAKKEKLVLEQGQAATPSVRESAFQTNQIIVPEEAIDDVAIRLKAWEIVDAYNQSLASLIAGNPEKTTDKTKILLRTIVGFSGQAIVSAASNISPAFAALSGIANEIGAIYEKNKILSVIEKVAPIINTQLIAQMRRDSELFYQVRYGLNNYRYQQINAKIGRRIAEFIKLAYAVNQESRNKSVLPMIKILNANLATLAPSQTGVGFKPIELKPLIGNDNSAQTLAQLMDLKEQILLLIEQAKQQDKVLAAYRQLLGTYIRLLNELDFQLKLMLQVAQQQQPIEVLMANDFSDSVLRMRQAYLYYQNNQPQGVY